MLITHEQAQGVIRFRRDMLNACKPENLESHHTVAIEDLRYIADIGLISPPTYARLCAEFRGIVAGRTATTLPAAQPGTS